MNTAHIAQKAAHKASYEAKRAAQKASLERLARRYKEGFCGQCGAELEDGDQTGFCSARCEQRYGECPRCGAPSRGGKVCWDCREE